MPHSAAGWRIEPPVSVPIAHGALPAATAAALPPELPPGTRLASHGFVRRAVGGVLRRRAHRELVLVRLGEQRCAGGGQALDGGRRVGRAVALEDPRAGLARDALRAEQVLDRDGDAGERSVAGLRSGVGDPGEGVVLVGGGAGAVAVPQLGGVEVARADARGRGGRGQGEGVAHAGAGPGLGTRKPPWSASGALWSATSAGSEGRGSSARRAFSTAITCEVGSTSARSPSSRDPLDVVEDGAQLLAHPRLLVLAQLEAREAGDMEHLVTAQHGVDSRARGWPSGARAAPGSRASPRRGPSASRRARRPVPPRTRARRRAAR